MERASMRIWVALFGCLIPGVLQGAVPRWLDLPTAVRAALQVKGLLPYSYAMALYWVQHGVGWQAPSESAKQELAHRTSAFEAEGWVLPTSWQDYNLANFCKENYAKLMQNDVPRVPSNLHQPLLGGWIEKANAALQRWQVRKDDSRITQWSTGCPFVTRFGHLQDDVQKILRQIDEYILATKVGVRSSLQPSTPQERIAAAIEQSGDLRPLLQEVWTHVYQPAEKLTRPASAPRPAPLAPPASGMSSDKKEPSSARAPQVLQPLVSREMSVGGAKPAVAPPVTKQPALSAKPGRGEAASSQGYEPAASSPAAVRRMLDTYQRRLGALRDRFTALCRC